MTHEATLHDPADGRYFTRPDHDRGGFTVHDRTDHDGMCGRFDTFDAAAEWITERTHAATLSGVYRVARRFYDDHVYRDLAAGELIRETKLVSVVRLNGVDYDELLADARYYADEMSDPESGYDDTAMIGSARSVVKALVKAGPPIEPTS